MFDDNSNNSGIAVIGMAGRFPGAANVEQFWQNLRDGVESISFFTEREMQPLTAFPERLRLPNYVNARGILEDVELFDAAFFHITPRDAELTDPQQRLFLECAWEALENAGYNSEKYEGLIGLYAGVCQNTYLVNNLFTNPDAVEDTSGIQIDIKNDKDYLTTHVSYKLNLKGPSVTVQTACSTSLVAIHQSCASLFSGECDMALAGGVCVGVPQTLGYLYKEGGILSPDGHCRPFSAEAAGTVGGNGLAIVVLKRLEDALADGDYIHAVVKGSAINNDGSQKVGFTAPSVNGQAQVIATAQAIAGVSPETISYIETHGTGTNLGDPIEVTALTQAFRQGTDKKQYCAIGAVKSNIGHLDAAAGVAGFIKTVLSLEHRQIPPSLHFTRPNPQIDFAGSPFYVNATLADWPAGETPRRAGVSSFGIGGTNAHVILEEAPARNNASDSRPQHLLTLSAKSNSALEQATANLVAHLRQYPEINLADVAYTLQLGRADFEYRRFVVCRDAEDAVGALQSPEVRTGSTRRDDRPVVFMFPGQGAQQVNMGKDLYDHEPTFRAHIDSCCELLQPKLGLDLREVLYPGDDQKENAEQQIRQTYLTQPALFVTAYALAQLWMEWGVRPQVMIGHSIGEYVAACLSGVISLKDCLLVVAERGRLMQNLSPGAMLAVPLAESEVQRWVNKEISVATINAPASCVLSGPIAAMDELERRLTEQGIKSRRLATSHAFHSPMMEPILVPFAGRLKHIAFGQPGIPFISNVTGTWIEPVAAASAAYWVDHLRQPVRFADGMTELCKDRSRIFLEAGFGRTLSVLAKQQLPEDWNNSAVFASLRPAPETGGEVVNMLETLGELWLAGARVDWSGLYRHEQRWRVPLPTYPFERKRHWIERRLSHSRVIDSTPDLPTEVTQPEDISLLERVMSEQLDLMTHQLELLRNPQPPVIS
ncbi:MAG TPA: type I polyketide synthase [Pyrinomonadaceae bacterium]